MLFNSAFSMRRYVDERNGNNPEPAFGLQMAVETQRNVAGHIDESRPWQVLYSNAWDAADLRLGLWHGRAARIEKVVDIHSMPSGSTPFVEYSFLLKSSTAKIWTGKTLDVRPWTGRPGEAVSLYNGEAFIARLDSWTRGAMLRKPIAWYYKADGTRVDTPIEVRFTITALETVRATKRIPRSLIAAALAAGSHLYTDATFTPDANPETNSVDGYVNRQSVDVSWSDMQSGSTSLSVSDTAGLDNIIYLNCSGTTNQFSLHRRTYCYFDTSSLSDTVLTASASFVCPSGYPSVAGSAGLSASLNVVNCTSTGTTELATGDWNLIGTTRLADTAIPWGTYGDNVRRSVTFNATGRGIVDVDGMTRLAWVMEHDAGGSQPPWASGSSSYMRILYADAGASTAPQMEITTGIPNVPAPIAHRYYQQLQGN
jgi:hypothetical protein